MVNIIVELSKYLMIICIAIYTYECFSVFGYQEERKRRKILRRQNVMMFAIHFMAYLVLYLKTDERKVLILYGMEVIFFVAIILLYTKIYPKVSRLIVNNMCMLFSIGFIMLTRLKFDNAVKQCVIASGAMLLSLLVPVIVRKVKALCDWEWLYAGIGIVALLIVFLFAGRSGGAKLGFSIAGFGVQPSEFVKITFVFFVAARLQKSTKFKDVVVTTILAALHVLLLVMSTDLGAALILFVVYLVMLYVATRQPLYVLAGLSAGSVAAVGAYFLFSHVRTRVQVWKGPISPESAGGHQVAQALFAIGTGSWFGMGLYQGAANTIPVATEDFIFAAIAEELGLIFALCLILICISCYVMFLNIAMQLHNIFYKLVALGLGTCYIFQIFLTIGGVTKFIPLTGVTLPLVSYGGSSVLSTVIMFAIIQGLYVLREDEEEDIEREKTRQERQKAVSRRRSSDPYGRRSGQQVRTASGRYEERRKK